MEVKTSFSDKLKAYRKQLKYTQEQLAKLLDFSIKSVQAWEQGQRKPPKAYQKYILEQIKREIEIQNFGKLKED